jgi:hypothetical protein
MNTNEAQLGIVCSRKKAPSTCRVTAREHFLVNKDKPKQRVIIAFDDSDIDYIINKKVNLLQYLEFKVFQVTANSFSSTWEMFENKST